ncbi:MAG: 3-keto-disaccharide hydrolase [Pirellulaceae bacterium]
MKKNLLFSLALVALAAASLLAGSLGADDKDKKDEKKEADWSASVKFPEGEKPVKLFNGKDLEGWEGNTGEGDTPKYFTVKDGMIVARNEKENAPKVSNYLFSKKKYGNFRLVFEGKLAESSMHSGIAIWGKRHNPDGSEPNSYQGHLVMFPSGWGFYDLYRRNSIYQDKDGAAKKADNGGWNKMEILAIGDRIRMAVNGKLVADWRDPKPELVGEGPLGLQLHSNPGVAQEVQFRGLILSENPKDEMATVEKK